MKESPHDGMVVVNLPEKTLDLVVSVSLYISVYLIGKAELHYICLN